MIGESDGLLPPSAPLPQSMMNTYQMGPYKLIQMKFE